MKNYTWLTLEELGKKIYEKSRVMKESEIAFTFHSPEDEGKEGFEKELECPINWYGVCFSRHFNWGTLLLGRYEYGVFDYCIVGEHYREYLGGFEVIIANFCNEEDEDGREAGKYYTDDTFVCVNADDLIF